MFTPLFAYALFRIRVSRAVLVGVGLAVVGLALLAGVGVGDPVGDLLVLAGSAAYSLQIALMERYACRYDAVAFTFVETSPARSPGSPRSPSRSTTSACPAVESSGGAARDWRS